MAKKSVATPVAPTDAPAPVAAPTAVPAAASATAPPAAAQPRSSRPRPEHKIGPFAGGIGVAIWLNTTDTEDGPRQFRSITIAPRRYQDRQTGEWRDSGSFHPSDLPALIFALQKAQEYVFTQPVPTTDPVVDNGTGDEIPF